MVCRHYCAGTTTTRYAWATVFGLAQIVSDGATEYVWGQELIAEVPIIGPYRYDQADALGSVRQATDSAGGQTATRQYAAFGAVRGGSGGPGTFGFAGEQADAESGLVYLRARLYDPATGRFLSRDPAGDCPASPLSAHAYLYGLANPARYTDPLGLSSWEGPAPSTDEGDYPGAQPYQGVGKPPVPDVDTQAALDDGICSATEPRLCIQSIMDLGLGATYIANYDQFVWTHNSPWSWFPKIGCGAVCNTLCSAGLCGAVGLPVSAACGVVCTALTANPVIGIACAATCRFYYSVACASSLKGPCKEACTRACQQ